MGLLNSQVARFIENHIHSVEQLETLLLLRQRKDTALSADEVSKELRTIPQSAAHRLSDLLQRGFCSVSEGTQPPAYRYVSGEWEGAIEALAESYRQKRIAVIEKIFNRPQNDLAAFAKAFDVRRKEDE